MKAGWYSTLDSINVNGTSRVSILRTGGSVVVSAGSVDVAAVKYTIFKKEIVYFQGKQMVNLIFSVLPVPASSPPQPHLQPLLNRVSSER